MVANIYSLTLKQGEEALQGGANPILSYEDGIIYIMLGRITKSYPESQSQL